MRLKTWIAIAACLISSAARAQDAAGEPLAPETLAEEAQQSDPASPPEPSERPAEPPAKPVPVKHRSQTLLLLDGADPSSPARAAQARAALGRKLGQQTPATPAVRMSDDLLVVSLDDTVVVELTAADVAAMEPDATMDAFRGRLQDRLTLVVADQARRAALQAVAVKLALALLVLALGAAAVAALRALFRRAEEYVDDHIATFRPLSVLGVPLLGPETVGSALAFALAIGRALTLTSVIAGSFALALWQFEMPRPYVERAGAFIAAPLLRAGDVALAAIPRIFLAALTVVALHSLLRASRMLLDAVERGDASWRGLTPSNARTLRVVVPPFLVLLVTPLIVATVFGAFHTPWETLALVAGGAGFLAALPVLANGAAGFVLSWRGDLVADEHIAVGNLKGVVERVDLLNVVLRTEAGQAHIPSVHMFCRSFIKHADHLEGTTIDVVVARDGPVDVAVDRVRGAVHAVSPAAIITLREIGRDELTLLLERVPAADVHRTLSQCDALGEPKLISARSGR